MTNVVKKRKPKGKLSWMKNSKSRDCSRNGNPLLAGSVKKCIKKVKSCLRSSLAGKSIEVSLNKVWRMGVLSKLLENYF